MSQETPEKQTDEPTEQAPEQTPDDNAEEPMNPPELDESRPHFTIGYDANNEERLVIKKGEGYAEGIDELEVARMLTTAQFQNSMGFFNSMLQHRENVKKAMQENRVKKALDEKKQERAKKKKAKKR